ncbi:MAG: YbbR-like domain-containing protein [Bacillota bacterium]
MIEKLLQKDVLVKVAAVIIALIVWLYVLETENPSQTADVTVDVPIQAPVGKILTSLPSIRVTVTFEGRIRDLERIDPKQVVIPLDISDAPAGQTVVPLEYVSPFPRVKVKDISPNMVTVTLAMEETKEVGVDVTVRGTPNKEYDAQRPTYSQATVNVTGPKSNVDRVQFVTGEIDVTGAVGNVTAAVKLIPYDAYGNEVAQITVNPATVQVTVPMSKKPPAKTVEVKVHTTGTPKKGFKLVGASAAPTYVEIRGEESVARRITSISTKPVDVGGRETGFSGEYSLDVPSGVKVETSAKVTVSVDIQPDIVTRTFSGVIVQVENLPIGFTLNIDPPMVDVKLTGRSDILERIQASDIQAFINAGDINPLEIGSRHEADRIVVPTGYPEGVKFDVTPPRVKLTLTKR